MKFRLSTIVLSGLSIIAGDIAVSKISAEFGSTVAFINSVDARVGRPRTPGSVAGVARRTTRRTLRRGAYYASLPKGCVRATVHGYAVWNCGGTYYQSSGGGYVVVVIN